MHVLLTNIVGYYFIIFIKKDHTYVTRIQNLMLCLSGSHLVLIIAFRIKFQTYVVSYQFNLSLTLVKTNFTMFLRR